LNRQRNAGAHYLFAADDVNIFHRNFSTKTAFFAPNVPVIGQIGRFQHSHASAERKGVRQTRFFSLRIGCRRFDK